jgi:hypothetical protein
MELARYTAAPGVGAGTLETIERAVDRLCRDFHEQYVQARRSMA